MQYTYKTLKQRSKRELSVRFVTGGREMDEVRQLRSLEENQGDVLWWRKGLHVLQGPFWYAHVYNIVVLIS